MKPTKPLVIGIIGGSGTGKTTLAKYLQGLSDALFIEGDVVGHNLLLDHGIQSQLMARFGQDLVVDGLVDRQRLGAIVFNNRHDLLALNHIMHPVMKETIRRQIDQTSKAVVVLEAAVMIEAGFDDLVDVMIYVKADEMIRVQRLIEGRGIDRKRALAMIKNGRKDYRDYSQIIVDTSFGIERIKKELDGLMDGLLEAMNESTD